MNENLSYSFHIGNDKNKTTKAKQVSKERPINFNNNAIQNAIQLSKVNHHNLRAYENNPELIMTIKGTNDIVKDIKEVYLDVFEESRINYNNKQTRDDRKIQDYFFKIANDNKHDLTVEIIIQLGDMTYWADKTIEEKYKMTDVFKNQVKELEKIVPLFKIANATIHFDESSPHLHIVGVPIKENCKTGMNKQVGKSDVFTVEILELIQTELREICINDFNKLFNLDKELKEKEKGRNEDLNVKLEEKERLLQVSKNTISDLKKKISNLEEQVNYWKNKFTKVLNHIKDKVLGVFGKDEEHAYRNIANDLYINNKVSYEDYENMLGRNTKNKKKDDNLEL